MLEVKWSYHIHITCSWPECHIWRWRGLWWWSYRASDRSSNWVSTFVSVKPLNVIKHSNFNSWQFLQLAYRIQLLLKKDWGLTPWTVFFYVILWYIFKTASIFQKLCLYLMILQVFNYIQCSNLFAGGSVSYAVCSWQKVRMWTLESWAGM